MSQGKGETNFGKTAQLVAAERRAFVCLMRRMGASYGEVVAGAIEKFGAESLPKNYDERQACQDVRRETDRLRAATKESLDDIREEHLAQLRMMKSRVLPLALGTETVPPDLRAVDKFVKILERESKLQGLDAPTKLDANIDFSSLSTEQLEAIASGKSAGGT